MFLGNEKPECVTQANTPMIQWLSWELLSSLCKQWSESWAQEETDLKVPVGTDSSLPFYEIWDLFLVVYYTFRQRFSSSLYSF